MRLLFVIENDEPHASGGGYYAPFKFAEFLARRGHRVTIYAVHDMGWVSEAPGLRIRYRPSLPRRNRLLRKADKALAAIGRRLLLEGGARAEPPDWVLGVFKESAIEAVRVGRLVGAAVANFVYECPPWLREIYGEEVYRRESHGYTRDLWERTRRAYLDSDLLFPNSELARRWNARWLDGREVAEPIHPGIDPEQMPAADPPGDPRAAGTAANDRAAGPGRLLCVGRLAPSKNIDQVIAACRLLDPPPHLHICGEGPEAKRLEALATGLPGVVFHGFVGESALWDQYRAADLVVTPSSFEGFGMPPMQALYFGRPALVSDIPIFRDVYGDRLEYFPPGDVSALAAAAKRLLADPGYRRRRGAEGRRFVLERFTWDEAARRIEAALLAASRRTPDAIAAHPGGHG